MTKGSRQGNYRPINILPVVSKVIEKVVAEQLVSHLNNKDLIPLMQFRCRNNYCNCMLLLPESNQN